MTYKEIEYELNKIKKKIDEIIEIENITLENNLFIVKNYKINNEDDQITYKKLKLLDYHIIESIKYDLQKEPFIHYKNLIKMMTFFEFHKLEVFLDNLY